MPFELFSEIALILDFPEYQLNQGDIATLIDFVPHPDDGETGCTLEIFNAVGESIMQSVNRSRLLLSQFQQSNPSRVTMY